MVLVSPLSAQIRIVARHLAHTHSLHLVESYCIPNFDSPSVFARILDKDKVRSSHRLIHCDSPLTSYATGRSFLGNPDCSIYYETELSPQLQRLANQVQFIYRNKL